MFRLYKWEPLWFDRAEIQSWVDFLPRWIPSSYINWLVVLFMNKSGTSSLPGLVEMDACGASSSYPNVVSNRIWMISLRAPSRKSYCFQKRSCLIEEVFQRTPEYGLVLNTQWSTCPNRKLTGVLQPRCVWHFASSRLKRKRSRYITGSACALPSTRIDLSWLPLYHNICPNAVPAENGYPSSWGTC